MFTRQPQVRIHKVRDRADGKTIATPIYDFLGGDDHYSASFGKQWMKYRDVQIDRCNGTDLSFQHLKWFAQDDLSVFQNAVCLEIGSGAGRFTDYLVDLCKTVITVDPSPAIYVNAAHGASNLIPCRADLFDVPVCREKVDVVFCRGVTQHTVDPQRAITQLFQYVKPGGLVLFDVYCKKWFKPFQVKYWLRPITRRIGHERFVALAERFVPPLLYIKSRVVNRLLGNGKLGQNIANQLIPIGDCTRLPELKTWKEQVEWSVLDTVDQYTPRYDTPMSWEEIMETLRGIDAKDIRGNWSTFCFRATAPEA